MVMCVLSGSSSSFVGFYSACVQPSSLVLTRPPAVMAMMQVADFGLSMRIDPHATHVSNVYQVSCLCTPDLDTLQASCWHPQQPATLLVGHMPAALHTAAVRCMLSWFRSVDYAGKSSLAPSFKVLCVVRLCCVQCDTAMMHACERAPHTHRGR